MSEEVAPAVPAADPVSGGGMEGDTSEEEVCRVCRGPAEENMPLFFPCKCSGSIKYIHENCLIDWLKLSNSTHCEVCKHPFQFTPVYADGTPTRLSNWEVAMGLLKKGAKMLPFALRLMVVLMVWGLLLPLFTSWTFRFMYNLANGEWTLRTSSGDWTLNLPTDLSYGSILSAGIVVGSLSAFTLREFIRTQYGDNLERVPRPQPPAAQAPIPVAAVPVQENQPDAAEGGDEAAAANGQPIGEQAGDAFNLAELNDDNNADGDAEQEPLAGDGVMGLDGGVEQWDDNIDPLLENLEQEMPFDEMIGLAGPMWNAFEGFLTLCAYNVLVLMTFFLCPFTIGKGVLRMNPKMHTRLATTGLSPFLLDALTVFVGFVAVFALGCLWLVATQIMRSQYQSSIFYFFRYCFLLFKVIMLCGVEMLAFPFFFGCLIDLCSVDLFGASLSGRLQFASESPIMAALVHWAVGILFMVIVACSVALLREVLQPHVLRFLRDPDDPQFHPIREMIEHSLDHHIKRIIKSLLLYVPMVLAFVRVPIVASQVLVPSIYPVNIRSTGFLDIVVIHILLTPAFDRIWHKEAVKVVMRRWFEICGQLVGVRHYLLDPLPAPLPEGTAGDDVANVGDVPAGRAEPEAEPEPAGEERAEVGARFVIPGDDNDEEPEPTPQVPVVLGKDPEGAFWLRIASLLTLAWLSILCGVCPILYIVMIVGRAVANSLGELRERDDLALFVGATVCYGVAYAVVTLGRACWVANLRGLIREALEKVKTGGKLGTYSLFGMILIPLLLGRVLNMSYTFLELSVGLSFSEIPVHNLILDWAHGVLITRPLAHFIRVTPFISVKMHRTLQQAHEHGWRSVNMGHALNTLFLPALHGLLYIISFPYVMAWGVLPALEEELPVRLTPELCNCVWRGLFMLTVSHVLVSCLICGVRSWFDGARDVIRDEQYLVGRKLHNVNGTAAGVVKSADDDGVGVETGLRTSDGGPGGANDDGSGKQIDATGVSMESPATMATRVDVVDEE